MTDDTTIEPEAADEASDAEAPADAAPVGAGLANEWTGGEPMSGRPETETGSADVEVLDEDALLEAGEDDEERYISPFDRPGKWFVLHTQSGYEKKVKQNLEARIASMNMENRIHEVVIPTLSLIHI